MARTRFSSITPVSSEISPFQAPIEQLALSLQAQQGRFDEGESMLDELNSRTINALPQQRARANTILQEINQEADSIVDKFDGDFAKANKALKMLTRKTNKLFRAGGEAAQIENNAQVFNKFVEDQSKRVGKKDGITSNQFNLAKNFILGNFQQLPDFDPTTQSYKRIDGLLEPIAANQDLTAEAFKLAKDIVPQVLASEGSKLSKDGRFIIDEKGNYTILSPDKIKSILQPAMMNNPQIIDFLGQTLKFSGQEVNMESISKLMQPAIHSAAEAFQRSDQDISSTFKNNQEYLTRLRAALSKDLARYKNSLEAPSGAGFVSRYTGTFNRPGGLDKSKISIFGNIKGDATKTLAGDNTGGIVPAQMPFGVLINRMAGNRNNASHTQQILSDYKEYEEGRVFDSPMKNAIYEAVVRKTNGRGSELPESQLKQIIVDMNNSLASAITVGQGVEVGYTNTAFQAARTETDIRSGAVLQGTFTYKDPETHEVRKNLTIDQVEDLSPLTREQIVEKGIFTGYNNPGTGMSAGENINFEDGILPTGAQLVAEDNTVTGKTLWENLNFLTVHVNPNEGKVGATRGSLRGILPDEVLGESGLVTVQSSFAVTPDGKPQKVIRIFNDRGEDISQTYNYSSILNAATKQLFTTPTGKQISVGTTNRNPNP